MAIRPTPLPPQPHRGISIANAGYADFARRHPEFIAELKSAREARRTALLKLRYSARRVQRDLVRQLLVNPHLHLFYAYEGLRKAGRLGSATPDGVRDLAARCDPFSPTAGGVRAHHVVKRGRSRLVNLYSPFKRMQQAIVADLIRALHPPRPEQFMFNGGMPMAFKAIEAAYRSGSHWAAEVDLIDFYGSVQQDRLAGLLRPLPASVVEHVVCDRASLQCVGRVQPPLDGPPGLSLGSATSPIVGETIIGLVLAQLPAGMQVMSYADNLLVLGQDRSEVVARAQTLVSALQDNLVVPLRPRAGPVAAFACGHGDATISDTGVEFTKQIATDLGGQLSWEPSPDRRLDQGADDITPAMSLDEVTRMEHRVVRWRRSYPAWQRGQRWESECLALLAGVRYFREPEPLHLSAAVNAIIAAVVAWDNSQPVEHFIPDAVGDHGYGRRYETLRRETERLLSGRYEPAAA